MGGMLDKLGRVLRSRREGAELTHLDVATRAGVSHGLISRLERGESWPQDPDRIVDAYAHELGVDAAELWGDAARE